MIMLNTVIYAQKKKKIAIDKEYLKVRDHDHHTGK